MIFIITKLLPNKQNIFKQNFKNKIQTLCMHVYIIWESKNIFSCINRINFTEANVQIQFPRFPFYHTSLFNSIFIQGSVFVNNYEKS